MSMLVWFTQLALSVALPPVGFILLAIWLRDSWNWGGWVLWVGIALGVICAFDGLRTSLRAMERMSRSEKEKEPPVSFHEHD